MIKDRVFETSTTSGTGSYTLLGAIPGARSFQDAFGAGPAKVYYFAVPANADGSFEAGIGTFTGPTTLARTSIIASSNANAAVNWGSEAKNIFCAPVAELMNRANAFVPAGTTGGTSTAYTASPAAPVAELNDGDFHVVKFHTACGDNPTYNPSSVGAKKLYKNVSGVATQLEEDDVPQNYVGLLRYDEDLDASAGGFWLTNFTSAIQDASITAAMLASSAIDVGIQDFRLTLTTGVPVTTSDVSTATTIYCTPYKGNRIALYDGTNWLLRSSSEFSLALGTLTADTNYDVFCYDNAGTPTLEFTAWTNSTTRATALAYQDGVLVKSGTVTRRYLGTFRTISTTQTCDTNKRRLLYNYYNRVQRPFSYQQSAVATWDYTTSTWRQANASSDNQVDAVQGVAETPVNVKTYCAARNTSAGCIVATGVGVDSTSAPSSIFSGTHTSAANASSVAWSEYNGIPAAGYHYFAWLEYSQAAGTTTWLGAANAVILGGMSGHVFG